MTTDFPLARLLWCGECEYPLTPRLLSDPPAYACSGCRRAPVDAGSIERLVLVATERHAPALVTGVAARCRGDLYRQLIVRVTVGAVPDDIAITWRI